MEQAAPVCKREPAGALKPGRGEASVPGLRGFLQSPLWCIPAGTFTLRWGSRRSFPHTNVPRKQPSRSVAASSLP